MAVPSRLRLLIGKREIKQSLGTGKRTEAIPKAQQCLVEAHKLFQRAEKRMATPRKQAVKETASDLLDQLDAMGSNQDGSFNKITLTVAGQKIVIEHEDPAKEVEAAAKLLSLAPSTAPPPTATNNQPTITLAKMVRAYFAEIKLTGTQRPKTQEENAAIFQLLGEVLKNPAASTIGFKLATDFKNVILRLPANRTKGIYAGKSVSEIIKSCPNVPMTITNVNKYLRKCSALFQWGLKHGHVSENPFSGLGIKQKSVMASALRDRFTVEELTKLFDPETLHKNMRKSYMFWLPWLALYTGARLEELSQLHLEDIRLEGEIWVLDINEKDEKDIKSPSSKRLIPIHPKLEEIGLLTHVKALLKRGEKRLFPELVHRRDGYGMTASKWFSRYRKTRGVGKTFHGIRHTVIDELKQKGVDYKLVAALAGHTDESMTFGRYGKAYNVGILKEVVLKLDFPLASPLLT